VKRFYGEFVSRRQFVQLGGDGFGAQRILVAPERKANIGRWRGRNSETVVSSECLDSFPML
jgi:hypothetical protein